MSDSIFTKIIKGEIPCQKVYEDDRIIAFLDIAPYTLGHTLVVPKQQIKNLWELDEELYSHVMTVAKKVAIRLREVLEPPRIGMMVDGYGLPDHTHVHVFPLYEGIEPTIKRKVQKPSEQELAEMAKRLAF